VDLQAILEEFAKGNMGIDRVRKELAIHSIEHVGEMAQLDVGRDLRRGLPEVVYAEGKKYRDTIAIALSAIRARGQVVVSRIKEQDYEKVLKGIGGRKSNICIESGKNSTTILAFDRTTPPKTTGAKIGIVAAGTSDIGVAEEARLVARSMGCESVASYDVGIAGIHRLFPRLKEMLQQDVGAIVVVAGMEGALASAVAALVDVPVIGVPTSVGYGFGSDGIAALASMLQSCTLGLAVVNIDNGIGAGAFAASIANKLALKTSVKLA
jgi:NCAIR mutase (PurE)-related protein